MLDQGEQEKCPPPLCARLFVIIIPSISDIWTYDSEGGMYKEFQRFFSQRKYLFDQENGEYKEINLKRPPQKL